MPTLRTVYRLVWLVVSCVFVRCCACISDTTLTRTRRRAAFQLETSNDVRISIDTELHLIDESKMVRCGARMLCAPVYGLHSRTHVAGA
jgi:hypothetical protein